jgi:tetratricopeptide (TPR) repeat protein
MEFRSACDDAVGLKDQILEAEAHHGLAWALRMQSKLSEAFEEEERALERCMHGGAPPDVALDVRRGMGDILRLQGKHAQAFDQYWPVLEQAIETGRTRFALAGSVWGLAMMLLQERHLVLADALNDVARTLYAPESRFHEVKCIRTAGEIALAAGVQSAERAEALLRDAMSGAIEIGDTMTHARCLRGVAELRTRSGFLAEAEAHWLEAERLSKRAGAELGVALSELGLAEIAYEQGRYSEAKRFCDTARTISAARQERHVLKDVLRQLELIARETGDVKLGAEVAEDLALVHSEIEVLPESALGDVGAWLDARARRK